MSQALEGKLFDILRRLNVHMKESSRTPIGIYVCPLDEVEKLTREHEVTHLVSLINGDMMPPTPAGVKKSRHLRLAMNDITTEIDGFTPPSRNHALELIAFIESWKLESPLLIHCWAGISRSTAAAFISLCALHPEMDEYELALLLRERSPSATPNSLMVANADDILGRRGRMKEAIEIIGRGEFASRGEPFFLPLPLNEENAKKK
jgi:predicted protein tyrosine phosphatase